MVSANLLSASGSPWTVRGVTYVGSVKDTYLWLCCEKDATLCLTSWWVSALDTPSTENVNTACSMTEWCPMPTILERTFSESMSSAISEAGLLE